MSTHWNHDEPASWPEAFDDERVWQLSGHTLTLRRVGKDAVARVGEELAHLRDLGDLSSLFDESELAPDALGLVASPPTHYLALTSSDLELEDVTCGAYDVVWAELGTGRQARYTRLELDGGDERLLAPPGLQGLGLVFVRRRGR